MKEYELKNKGRAFFNKIAKSKVFDDLMFAVHKTNDFLDYGNGILKVAYYNKDIIHKIVRSGLHIYNMAIYCILMRNKIFNKIL